jgi:integrase
MAKLVKLYKVPYAGKDRWEIRWKWGGKIQRRKRTVRKHALLLKEEIETKLANGRTLANQMSDEDGHEWNYCKALAARFGLTPRQLMDRGAADLDQLNAKVPANTPIVGELVQQFIAAKRAQGISALYLRDFETRLPRFAQDFKLPIGNIMAQDLQAWLDGLKVGPRTWNNYRSDLAALFTFAVERRHLPPEWSELAQLKPIKIRKTRTLIFTVLEMEDILAAATDRLLPAIAIGAFAGLRSEEILRLRWENIHWPAADQAGYIRVPKEITKNNRDRDVPLVLNLVDWLNPWVESSGMVCDYRNLSVGKTNLAARVGTVWKRNGLRHSFISYRLAAIQNDAQVALEAGTSAGMIHSRYKDLVRPKDAVKWFEIRPKTVTTGILNLKFR